MHTLKSYLKEASGKQYELLINIYEDKNPNPVLGHIFHGKTKEEVQGVIDAHMKTDSFFHAAMTSKKFQGMTLRIEKKWLVS